MGQSNPPQQYPAMLMGPNPDQLRPKSYVCVSPNAGAMTGRMIDVYLPDPEQSLEGKATIQGRDRRVLLTQGKTPRAVTLTVY